MGDESFEDVKAALRLRAHAARSALSVDDRAEAASAVAALFFSRFTLQPDAVVAAYWTVRDELDCQPILAQLMARNQPVVLPAVPGPEQPLQFRVWEQGAALDQAGFGTLAPSALAPKRDPDLVIVPLLGFDKRGTRLGYGGGYYDRTLAQMKTSPQVIGLAFAAQELDHIPRDTHDVPLDAVITEAGVRHFGADA